MNKLLTPYFCSVLLLTACGGTDNADEQSLECQTTNCEADNSQQQALNKISQYAKINGALVAPNLQDYRNAGVVGVTNENLTNVNQAIAALSENEVDTYRELQTVLENMGVISPGSDSEIISIQGPGVITPGETITVKVDYSSAGNRVVVLELKNTANTYFPIKKNQLVAKDSGTAVFAVQVPNDVPTGTDYRLFSYITTSLTGAWKERVGAYASQNVEVVFDNSKVKIVNVCSNYEVANAVAYAQPGDKILLCDGAWTDLKLIVDRSGTENLPIVIAAKNPGKVTISGDSYINIAGSNVHISGFRWKDYADPAPYTSYIRTASGTSRNKISEMVFEDSTRAPFMTWIFNIALRGGQHEVFNTAFLGKDGRGAQLLVQEGGEYLEHNLHHLYFSRDKRLVDSDGKPLNGGESLQIGAGSRRDPIPADDVNAHHLYFENASGEGEIISLKGNRLKLNDIVMQGCQGAFSFRAGNNTQLSRVFIDGKNKPRAIGLRLFGKNHHINDVFITGVYGKWKGGIFIESARDNVNYAVAENILIENLTIMDSLDNISIGTGSTGFYPSNIQFKSVVAVTRFPDESRVLFVNHVDNSEYTFIDSILFGKMNVNHPGGVMNVDPLLTPKQDGLFIPETSGLAAGKGSQMSKLPVYKHETGPQVYSW
jgi:poly(beta-D-mannuronate) lyase